MLHPASQVGFARLDQGMDVIGHPAVGEDIPTAPGDLVLQSCGETFVGTGIVEQRSPSVTARNAVVVRPGKLDSWRTRHRA